MFFNDRNIENGMLLYDERDYWKDEDEYTYEDYLADETDKRLERQALSTLKVVWANRKKKSKDGQYKLPLGDYYKEIFEAFSE